MGQGIEPKVLMSFFREQWGQGLHGIGLLDGNKLCVLPWLVRLELRFVFCFPEETENY